VAAALAGHVRAAAAAAAAAQAAAGREEEARDAGALAATSSAAAQAAEAHAERLSAAAAASAAARRALACALHASERRTEAMEERIAQSDASLAACGAALQRVRDSVASLERRKRADVRSLQAAKARARAVPHLEAAVASLQADLLSARREADTAEATAAATAAAASRSPPPEEAMAARNADLHRRLEQRHVQLTEAEAAAAAAAESLADGRARLAGCPDAPRLAAQMNEHRARLWVCSHRVHALKAELRLYVAALERRCEVDADVPPPSAGELMASEDAQLESLLAALPDAAAAATWEEVAHHGLRAHEAAERRTF
jgi:hypothetical protein